MRGFRLYVVLLFLATSFSEAYIVIGTFDHEAPDAEILMQPSNALRHGYLQSGTRHHCRGFENFSESIAAVCVCDR